MSKTKHAIRTLLFMFTVTSIMGIIIYDYAAHNPVFGPPRFVPEDVVESRESYLKNREIRNIKSMNMSYDQLMQIGQSYQDIDEWILAIEYFKQAKSLFPTRIEPRVKISYLYLIACQEDWRYCRWAKREVYYAMKYIDNTNQETSQYLKKLVNLLDINALIAMEENEALTLIF